jgi:hypothetical protein
MFQNSFLALPGGRVRLPISLDASLKSDFFSARSTSLWRTDAGKSSTPAIVPESRKSGTSKEYDLLRASEVANFCNDRRCI